MLIACAFSRSQPQSSIALALLPAAASAGVRQHAIFQDENLIVENGETRGATLDEAREPRRGHDQGAGQLGVRGTRHAPQAERVRRHGSLAVPGLGALRRGARGRQGARLRGHVRPRSPGARLGHAEAPRPRRRRAARTRASSGASRRPRRGASPASTCGRSGTSRTTLAISTPSPRRAGGRSRRTIYRAHGARRGPWSEPRRGGARSDPVRRAPPDRQAGASAPSATSSRSPSCARSSTGRRSSGLDGFAYHPYTRCGGPARCRSRPCDDATVRSYGRILRVARLRPRPRQAPLEEEASDLEHGVRLPDEPARPLWGAASRACRATGRSPSSGSPTRTGASSRSRSTR